MEVAPQLLVAASVASGLAIQATHQGGDCLDQRLNPHLEAARLDLASLTAQIPIAVSDQQTTKQPALLALRSVRTMPFVKVQAVRPSPHSQRKKAHQASQITSKVLASCRHTEIGHLRQVES